MRAYIFWLIVWVRVKVLKLKNVFISHLLFNVAFHFMVRTLRSWCALCAPRATSDCSLIYYKTGGGGFGKNYDFQGGSPPPLLSRDGKRSKNFWIRSEKYIVKIWNIAICLLHPCKPVTSELVSQAKHNTFLDNLNRLSYLWWRM